MYIRKKKKEKKRKKEKQKKNPDFEAKFDSQEGRELKTKRSKRGGGDGVVERGKGLAIG